MSNNKVIEIKNPEFTTAPSSSDLEFLTEKINEETNDFGAATSFEFSRSQRVL